MGLPTGPAGQGLTTGTLRTSAPLSDRAVVTQQHLDQAVKSQQGQDEARWCWLGSATAPWCQAGQGWWSWGQVGTSAKGLDPEQQGHGHAQTAVTHLGRGSGMVQSDSFCLKTAPRGRRDTVFADASGLPHKSFLQGHQRCSSQAGPVPGLSNPQERQGHTQGFYARVQTKVHIFMWQKVAKMTIKLIMII